ncbi:MAG: hypothetical protein Q8L78_03225 [Coxiellaceae bacterium]|nr:hypothetical protein [Coxiellaceae bacterium]
MQKFFSHLKKQRFLALLFLFITCVASASDDSYDYLFPSRTVYVGVNVGGGSTEWQYLVDTTDPDGTTSGTTPTDVSEGGPSWGVVFGYLVGKNFAFELQYMQFANSTITLDGNTYPQVTCSDDFDRTGCSPMVSKTDAYSLSGKLFVPVGKTHMRVFAAVGAGLVQRSDVINHTSSVAPYMSAGLDYNFTRHWILESGFQYYTGFGASEVDPVDDFIPFAWDAYARIAYQF